MAGLDRRFRALLCAHAVSAYGTYLNLIALSLFAYEVTGGAFGVGVVMALRLASGFLAGFAAPRLAAVAGRRSMMVGADLGQAAAMTVLVVVAGDATASLSLLGGVVVVLGAGNTLFSVALRSSVPVMVGDARRGEANGLLVTLRSFATVLGFASATPVVAVGGYAAAFGVNAVSFVVSATVLLTARPRMDVADRTNDVSGSADASSWSENGGGLLRGLLGLPVLLIGMVLLRGVDALASSSHNVGLPVLAQETSPSEPALMMTQFWASWAVGTLLAHQVLKRRRHTGGRVWDERGFAIGTCAMSVCFALAFTGLPGIALMLVALGAGLGDGYTEIIYTSRLQEAPDGLRNRVFGISAAAETAGFTVGAVSAAAALDVLPAWVVVGFFHGLAVCAASTLLLFLATRRRRGRHLSKSGADEGEDARAARTGTGPIPGP